MVVGMDFNCFFGLFLLVMMLAVELGVITTCYKDMLLTSLFAFLPNHCDGLSNFLVLIL